ncbi:MAG TPA: UDP-N-acetylglucosamine 1-carboxyvinyltransferase [Gemmatimonadaceae bacterium]
MREMPAVQYVVEGGRTLHGTIRPSGNKNAALPIVAAALLSDKPVYLENVPHIRDIETLIELIVSVGAQVEWTGPNALRIEASDLTARDLDSELCAKIRASILLAAPLLARCGEIMLPPPGGDVIGRRRLDTHFLALEQLGAKHALENGLLRLSLTEFRGADVFLDEPSVTATENALVAAVAAKGKTILRNAASEPHVQDLARFLTTLGAHIEGAGTNCITIEGGKPLAQSEVRHTIGPDHIEVGSFIGLAAVTHSEIRIQDAGIEHLRSTRMGFERLGIVCEVENDDLIVPAKQSLKIQADMGDHVPKLEDQPWPAFPADTMSIAIVTATQCEGLIMMHEKMFESRLFFVDKLIGMGAKIVLCDPHRALVAGPSKLRGATLDSPDIRAGMALLIAALCADGRSIINNVGQIERGYERIDHRLRQLGASVERVADRRK